MLDALGARLTQGRLSSWKLSKCNKAYRDNIFKWKGEISPVKSRFNSLSATIPVTAIGKNSPKGLKERFNRVSEVNLARSGGIVDI